MFARSLTYFLVKASDRTAKRWKAAAARLPGMDPEVRRSLRAARAKLSAALLAFDRAQEGPRSRDREWQPPVELPPGTEWAGRPEYWRRPESIAGLRAPEGETRLGGDAGLFHDCPLGHVLVAQRAAAPGTPGAPYFLRLEVFGFTGSYLSLVHRLPRRALDGLGTAHVLRLELPVRAERPVPLFVRLNLRCGPNTHQMVVRRPGDAEEDPIEFDLVQTGIDEGRVDEAWLDVMLEERAQTALVIRDLWLVRHLRAEL